MALTKEMKKAVNDFIWETLITENDKSFNTLQLNRLIMSNFGITVSPQVIGVILSHEGPDPDKYIMQKRKDYNDHVTYTLKRVNTYTLKKERSQVFFINSETGSNILICDYNAPEGNNPSDRITRSYDRIILDDDSIRSAATIESTIRVAPEWVFSYPDLFSSIIVCGDYANAEMLPRTLLPREKEISEKIYEIMSVSTFGYTLGRAIRDTHKIMTDESFDINIFNTLTKNQLKFILNYDLIRKFYGFKNALRALSIIDKFSLTQIKNYKSIQYDKMVETLKEMNSLNWLNNINTNHSFDANVVTFNNYKREAKNKIFAEKLQKLNFLNGLEVGDNCVIIVPQTLNDLVLEGHMQNNCVGHFYNDSIMAGENYIYFIRSKKNPKKSYITCRFNKRNHATVEYRHKNNEYREHRELISAIDAIINENLKGE